MFQQADWIIDQIEAFASGLANQLLGRREITEVVLSGDELSEAAGLSLDVLETLPVHTALGLLAGPDGLASARTLALAMGLVERCLVALSDGDAPRASRLADQAVALSEAALADRPDLASPGVVRVLELISADGVRGP